jgi:hypothetical protein
VYGWFIKGLESLPSNEVSIRPLGVELTRSPRGRGWPLLARSGRLQSTFKRTLWIVAADAGTEGANVRVAEAFALEAKSVNTLDRPVHFRSRDS